MKKPKHPMQPVWVAPDKVVRFVPNEAVHLLLEHSQKHGFGLNELMFKDISQEDRMQLAQLLGYSVSGFGDLSYADPDVVAEADAKVRELLKMDPTVAAGEIKQGEFFRKKSGSFVYMAVSESAAKHYLPNPENYVYGVCFNGNVCAVKKGARVIRMEREDFFVPAEEQKRWEEAVGANPEADDE
jgi:hypothetical protein